MIVDYDLMKIQSSWKVKDIMLGLFEDACQNNKFEDYPIKRFAKPIYDGVLEIFREDIREKTGLALLRPRFTEDQRVIKEEAIKLLNSKVLPYVEAKAFAPSPEMKKLIEELTPTNLPAIDAEPVVEPVTKKEIRKKIDIPPDPKIYKTRMDFLHKSYVSKAAEKLQGNTNLNSADLWGDPDLKALIRDCGLSESERPKERTVKDKWVPEARKIANVPGKRGVKKQKN